MSGSPQVATRPRAAASEDDVKTVIWVSCAVLALLWTGGAALIAQLVGWSAQAMAGGGAADLGGWASSWSLPAWLGAWFDPAAIGAVQQAVVLALDGLREWLPAAGAAVGWLVPAVWLLWGLGLAVLLIVAAVANLLARRAALPAA